MPSVKGRDSPVGGRDSPAEGRDSPTGGRDSPDSVASLDEIPLDHRYINKAYTTRYMTRYIRITSLCFSFDLTPLDRKIYNLCVITAGTTL